MKLVINFFMSIPDVMFLLCVFLANQPTMSDQQHASVWQS